MGTDAMGQIADCCVRVWSTNAIYQTKFEQEYDGPTQLAHMSYHSGVIHTVRFSGNGKYLASGGDDKFVCVYTLDPNPPAHTTFGSGEKPPVESWKIFRRLVGHDNDVQDIAWSYDSSVLVSVGLDSKVVVWSGYTFEKLKTLPQHSSHVKGITFDPASKWFATASDDRTIRIWTFIPPGPNTTSQESSSNFVCERVITDPFKNSPLTTYFRRCSWSPDGSHIAAANAVNGPVSTIAIINRGTWDSEINLVGHEAPVEVCAFAPRMFAHERPSAANQDGKGFSNQHLVTVIACAGQDKTLTLWNTSNPRPVTVTRELTSKAISDISWAPDAKSLFITSLDGKILCIEFDDTDSSLGYVVGAEENEKALQKFGVSRRGVGVVEGPEGFLLEERSRAGELRGVEGRMGELMGDGRDGEAATATTNGSGAATPNALVQRPTEPPKPAPPPQRDINAEKIEKLKQRVTITKDGKKRVAPMLVSSNSVAQSSLPQAQLRDASSTNGGPARNDGPQTILDLSKPFDGLPKGGLQALLLGNKRKVAALEADINGEVPQPPPTRGVAVLAHGEKGLVPAENPMANSLVEATPQWIRPAVVHPIMTISTTRLAVPRLRVQITIPLRDHSTTLSSTEITTNGDATALTETPILEARNPTARPQDREPARITVTRKGQIIWSDFVPKPILLATGSVNFWAAACEDGSIHIWTPAGRRLLNAMIVDAQPVILECKDWYLLCVNAIGMCHVWNLKDMKSPHPPVSLAPVLAIADHPLAPHPTPAPAITEARLNSKGAIIVTLTNGDGYTYNLDLYTWQRLSEAWWAVGSQYWNTTDSSISNLSSSASTNDDTTISGVSAKVLSAGIIPHLERATTNEVLLRGRAYYLQRLVKSLVAREGYEGFESTVSIAHLENRLAAALQLGAKEEFRVYLDMYAKRLGAEGARGKVEELLRGLMGGIMTGSDDAGEAFGAGDVVCGWSREELLRGVVLILGKHRELQRITVPYAKVLGVVEEDSVGDGDVMVT